MATIRNPKTMHFQSNISLLQLFITLIVGVAIGFTFSQLLNTTQHDNLMITTSMKSNQNLCKDHEILQSLSSIDSEEIIKPLETYEEPEGEIKKLLTNTAITNDLDTEIADRLFKEVKVLCWVLTGPQNHEKKAIHVKNTWGSRCNKLLFMSSKEDKALGAIDLKAGEGRGNLWNKTREAFKYVYDHHFNEYDWFLKADDDTYVIMENLRAFLYSMSPNAAVYFGSKFKPHVRQGYMSGGAGYVLSKEALRLFAEHAYPNRVLCRQTPGGSEDKEMGTCLQNVGVVAGDSRDELKRGRFFPTSLYSHIIPKPKSSWYWRYIFYATEDGLNCCSDYSISFHYVQPNYMYVMDFLVYKLRPYGIVPKDIDMPKKNNMSVLLDKWRNEISDNPL
ncbi:Glycoprotein-N-acetylgalactosamine 3-beta-galactosyltransferase 1 [Lucilia cuprina]|nr:Glycoprotein-N-acetylgalactosamine 3-beta-galactosyltransferase 1 [Lucilia cuprina]